MPSKPRIRPLLDSIRLPNLPSVLSNVWLGAALAAAIHPTPAQAPLGPATLLCMVAGLALYLAGNLLNDWHDRSWDAIHRPERALPAGLLPPALYLSLGLGLLLAGMAAATAAHPAAGAVSATIAAGVLAYTRLHKAHPSSVWLVALCRAGLPLLVPAAMLISLPVPPAALVLLACPPLAILLYVVALSLAARHEAAPPPSSPRRFNKGLALLILPPLLMALALPAAPASTVLLAICPCAAWLLYATLRHRRNVPSLVSSLLAGMPLLDWVALIPLGLLLRSIPQLHPQGTLALALPPAAFLAALALQRISKAT